MTSLQYNDDGDYDDDDDVITHAPLFRGGADHVYESPLGDSCFGNEYL